MKRSLVTRTDRDKVSLFASTDRPPTMVSTSNSVPLVTIPADDSRGIAKLTSVITSAFIQIPISTALIFSLDAASPTPLDSVSLERLYQHFEPQIQHAAQSGSILLHTGDWSIVAIWEPPHYTPMEEPSRASPLLKEFKSMNEAAMRKYLRTESLTGKAAAPFYRLNFIARNPDRPAVAGAFSAAVVPFMDRARDEGVPVWLEAASLRAAGIYEHFGFRMVEEMTVGVGEYGRDGLPKANGEGVTVYAMICDSHVK